MQHCAVMGQLISSNNTKSTYIMAYGHRGRVTLTAVHNLKKLDRGLLGDATYQYQIPTL